MPPREIRYAGSVSIRVVAYRVTVFVVVTVSTRIGPATWMVSTRVTVTVSTFETTSPGVSFVTGMRVVDVAGLAGLGFAWAEAAAAPTARNAAAPTTSVV